MASLSIGHFTSLVGIFLLSTFPSTSFQTHFQLSFGYDEVDSRKERIDTNFHACSLNKVCNYLVKNKKTASFTQVPSKVSLPKDEDNYVVWEKIKIPEKPYASCKDALNNGKTESGIFTLLQRNGQLIRVYCDMATDGGGWAVIQRRIDGSTNFNKTWEEYKRGFGSLELNFWLGLANIRSLTMCENMTLRIELKSSDGRSGFGKYATFKVSSESYQYRLENIGIFKGTIGDAMSAAKHLKFSTWDRDNDHGSNHHCAFEKGGGWWFGACLQAGLNSLYPGEPGTAATNMIKWVNWQNASKISFCAMKLKNET